MRKCCSVSRVSVNSSRGFSARLYQVKNPVGPASCFISICMPHEHNLVPPSERSFHPFALFLLLPCGGKQFVAIVCLICNEDLFLCEVRDNEESIAATLRYEYFIFLYINKTQHVPATTTGCHTFFPVVLCESVYFRGEGFAVRAGITSLF